MRRLALCILAASLTAACASTPSATVKVDPTIFDPAHTEQAWYIHVVQERTSGMQLVHDGFVCNDEAEFTVRTTCPERTTLRGTVWRVPRSFCGRRRPVVRQAVTRDPNVMRIAKLKPAVLWPEHEPVVKYDRGGPTKTGATCSTAETRSYRVELHPPIEPVGLCLSTGYWSEADYQLEE